jgi:hypothetical protein
MMGDGGDSDAEGDGYEIVQSFVEGMIDVERERFNEDGFQIEREVECDDNTAVECETPLSPTLIVTNCGCTSGMASSRATTQLEIKRC